MRPPGPGLFRDGVVVRQEDSKIILSVEDDGRGFDARRYAAWDWWAWRSGTHWVARSMFDSKPGPGPKGMWSYPCELKPRRDSLSYSSLADDHTVMRNGLRLLLERQPDLRVVGEAADGAQAVDSGGGGKP